MKDSKISNIFTIGLREQKDTDSKVSYSQYTMYANCPHHWKLEYMEGHKKRDPSIFLIFGTAMHETIQEWLSVLYTKSPKEASELELGQMLYDYMIDAYKAMKEDTGCDFSSPDELKEFLEDGIEILDFIVKNRLDYFNTRQLNLVGIELPIYTQAIKTHKVYIRGFLDLVFEDTYQNKLVIWDIKTSTRGWNKWQKADKTKTAQLVLYKKYLSEQYGYPLDRIDVKYFIVKRKLVEGMMYAQKRVQQFIPANGSVTLNKVTKSFENFIRNSFNEDGTYRLESEYPAIKGKNGKNCKWCSFKNDYEKCPKENRHAV
tara:strand:+ start:812 stop:1759 length:948 start_codon:yes stop_codon:yes gene_type:complete